MRLPISWISSMADWFQVPAVSTATGKKIWEAYRQRTILYSLVCCCLVCRLTCFSGSLVYMYVRLSILCQELWRPMPWACLVPKVTSPAALEKAKAWWFFVTGLSHAFWICCSSLAKQVEPDRDDHLVSVDLTEWSSSRFTQSGRMDCWSADVDAADARKAEGASI